MLSTDHLKKALELKVFDAISAQNMMAPRPRTSVRPPEKKGSPKQGAVMLLLYTSNVQQRQVQHLHAYLAF